MWVDRANAFTKASSPQKSSSRPLASQTERSSPLQRPTLAQKAELRKHPRKSSLSSVTKLPDIKEESPPKPKVHAHKRNKSSLNPSAMPFLPTPNTKKFEQSYTDQPRKGYQSMPSYPVYDGSTQYIYAYANDHRVTGERGQR